MSAVIVSGLTAAWTAFMAWVPRIISFLAILLIGGLIAMMVQRLASKLLDQVHFDRLIERGELKVHMDRAGYSASRVFAQLCYYTIWLFTLTLAFNVFGPNPVSDLLSRIIAFLPNVFVAILIVVLSAAIATGVRNIVKGMLGGLSYGPALSAAAWAAILVVGVFAALDQLHIAPMIVNGIFYAMLAIIVGSAIVSIGGSGIAPMRQFWDSAIGRMQLEAPRIQQEAENARLRAENARLRMVSGGGAVPDASAPQPPPPTIYDSGDLQP